MKSGILTIIFETEILISLQEWFVYILNHPEKCWNHNSLSRSVVLMSLKTFELISKHLDLPWNFNQ